MQYSNHCEAGRAARAAGALRPGPTRQLALVRSRVEATLPEVSIGVDRRGDGVHAWETHVIDKALELGDQILPRVRIPSRWDYQKKRRSEVLREAAKPGRFVLVPHLSRSRPRNVTANSLCSSVTS